MESTICWEDQDTHNDPVIEQVERDILNAKAELARLSQDKDDILFQ